MADTNSILWQMADQVRARLGNADLYATKVSLATAVSEQIADTISNLNGRMSVLEGGGGSQIPSLTSQPVTWTNLSEIRFGTELITNEDFDLPTIALGVDVEVIAQWVNDGKTASVGEIYTVDQVGLGAIRLTGGTTPSQSLLTSAAELPNRVVALHPYKISANLVGSTFASSDIGRTIILLPGSGMMSDSSWNLTIGKPYTITQQDTGTNRVGFRDNNSTFIWLPRFGGSRGVDWEFSQQLPYGWTINDGEIDTTELASGNLKGVNGPVSIKQTFTTPIPTGTKLAVTIGRPASQLTGECDVTAEWSTGEEKLILDYGESGEFIVPANKVMTGIRLATRHVTRIITDVSLFEGAIANGTAQATTSTLSKISGVNGYNTGGSSSQAIPAGQDGYFQFQYGNTGSVEVGLTYLDDNFSNTNGDHFSFQIGNNGSITTSPGINFGIGFAPVGTWLRIRHYAGDNQIKFQRLQDIYAQNINFALPTTPNNGHASDHTFAEEDRPLVIALQTANGMTEGSIYRLHVVTASNGNGKIYELDGTLVGWIDSRGTKWQVVDSAGQDYVTFHTSVDTTTNAPLYLDTSLFHIGSQINDATLVS